MNRLGKYISVIACLVMLVSLGASFVPAGVVSAQSDGEAEARVDQAMAHLSSYLNRTITRDTHRWVWEGMTFPSEGLGCEGGGSFAQRSTYGYQIDITVDDVVYDYRVRSDGGTVILCFDGSPDASSIYGAVPTVVVDSLATNVFTGFLWGDEAVFDSPVCGPNTPYFSFTTSFDASGTYAYGDANYLGIASYDIQIEVYEDSFDPADPETNYVGSYDDEGVIVFSGDTSYVIVVVSTQCATTTAGEIFFTIAGPGQASAANDGEVFNFFLSESSSTFTPERCSEAIPYEVVGPLAPSLAGTYYYRDVSYGQREFIEEFRGEDMDFAIYADEFNPEDPSANLFYEEDDLGQFSIDTGETGYYFVASVHDCANPTGRIQAWLYGPLATVSEPQPMYAEAGGEMMADGAQTSPDATYVTGDVVDVDGTMWVELYRNHIQDGFWVPLEGVTVQ